MRINELLQNKRYLFWVFQFAGWSGWGVSYYLGILVGGDPPRHYEWYLLVISLIGIGLTLGLRALYHYTWDMSIARRIVALLLGSYLAGLTWMAIRATIYANVFPDDPGKIGGRDRNAWYDYFDGSVSAFWVMLVWSGLYFGIKYYLLVQEDKQRLLKAMSMAQEAQLKMLRYQLNPHFLFNTLNAISTLILDQQTQLANTMVSRLSRFLRYSLDNDPMAKVTVAEEFEALTLYLDIEKVRFGERLQLHFHLEPEAREALVPSLLLQPLVENSIKYAIANAVGGGSIGVSACVDNNELVLAVADDGPGLDMRVGRNPKGGGVGLNNIRDRLRELYGERQSFRLGATEPHGLTTTVRLPLERAKVSS
ncbi:histidine kinase [Haliea sp. E1-2-M8]|uniref:sensor histidine kinase n=1 Tax=Haliea sp. E1-2-M8 TaxID=3064706 RepID=UPI00271CF980|nr:histidine kinase [Haliea sp. E1-2-M8]MDO8862742.1 histidine kinase [Haliea sp. E1-2-M8]